MIGFLAGLFIGAGLGAALGVTLVCCLVVSREADEALDSRLRAAQGTEHGA
ncbi:MAG: DUF3789 domain-containing protein [Sinobacteraceae bacterium]|nr:DUF3789 domain-containing protein [Nevskiaceae bacterium]